MYVNYLGEKECVNSLDWVDIGSFRLLLFLHADYITIFSETEEGLQNGINILMHIVTDGSASAHL